MRLIPGWRSTYGNCRTTPLTSNLTNGHAGGDRVPRISMTSTASEAPAVRPSDGRVDVRAGRGCPRGPTSGLKASARPPCRPAGQRGPPLLPNNAH